MTIRETIRQLACQPPGQGPFLSLYIDTNRGDGSRNDRVRLMMKHELASVRDALRSDREAVVERGVRQIEGYLAESLRPETRGVAIFAAPEIAFFLPLEFSVPLEPQLNIGHAPYLRQLTAIRDNHPHLLAALVDGKYARLLEIELGAVVVEETLEEEELPRKTDQGGWSQANIQRHIQDHKNHHHKEAAERLAKMFDHHGGLDVILSGQDRNAANFRGYLPKRVDERIIGTLRLDIRAPRDEIVARCEASAIEWRRGRLAQRLVELESASRKNGRAAVGSAKVVSAVNERRIDELLISSGASLRGWKCTGCPLIGEVVPLGCPVCGETVMSVDLIEEIVASSHQEGATITLVDGESLLDRYQGIGAFLRF